MKNTITHRCNVLNSINMGIPCVLVAMAFLSALPAGAEDKTSKTTPEAASEAKLKESTAIGLWVDFGLGLVSEEEMKDKAKSFKPNYKTALGQETDALTGDLHGARFVTGKQFAALVERTNEVSSFCSFKIIGTTRDRAYLEAEFHLSSRKSYVAVVSAPRKEVPDAILAKILEQQRGAK